MKKKTPKKSYYKNLLDGVFSRYIRLKYADESGYVHCYTCGITKHWKEVDNGHFLSRSKMSTRWDEDNCRPQCKGCNGPRGGEIAFFAHKLLKELGKKKFDALIERGKTMRQWTQMEIHLETRKYQMKINKLKVSP